ncbi:helix-turn-helix domain-containing protein [Brotaphodocola sp.]|uniref:helix-turn-helix domain-containing protein n=1 Tax=Brotaphodocola sp. TaxID=3073577 RepID=UPI003D7F0977
MNAGKKIKSTRLAKRISQKKLGEMIGTSQQMIAQYEKGARNPKIQTLQKIADALDVHLSALLDNDTYEIKFGAGMVYNPFTGELEPTETEYIDLTDRAKLIDYYDNLNTLGKQEALKRISELAEIEKYITPDTPPDQPDPVDPDDSDQ